MVLRPCCGLATLFCGLATLFCGLVTPTVVWRPPTVVWWPFCGLVTLFCGLAVVVRMISLASPYTYFFHSSIQIWTCLAA